MPIAFIAIGILFLTAAVRGTLTTNKTTNQEGLIQLLEGDFVGQDNFTIWIVAILALGATGYIPGFKPIANAFLALFLIVIFLSNGNPSNSNGGVFAQLTAALNGTKTAGSAGASTSGSSLGNAVTGIQPISVPTTADYSSLSLNL